MGSCNDPTTQDKNYQVVIKRKTTDGPKQLMVQSAVKQVSQLMVKNEKTEEDEKNYDLT